MVFQLKLIELFNMKYINLERKLKDMKNIYYFALALQLFVVLIMPEETSCLEFSSQETEWIYHVEKLKFSEVEWEPLSYVDEYPVYKGIIADYLKIISEATGIEMDFIQSKTWQEVLDKFVSKDIDLIPALSSDDYIGTDVLLTEPYISFPLIIATRPDIDFISNTNELVGKKVGVGEGYTSYHFLNTNYPDIELVTSSNVVEGLKMLHNGKIDAFVGHMAVVMDAIRKSDMDLSIAGKTEYVFEHRIGLPPEHELTVSIINKVLEEITPEEHNRIYNRWIKMNVETPDYSLVWKILLSSIAIIIIIIYRYRRLSKEKKQIQQLFNDLNILKNELEVKNCELNKLAITDQLTGLYNRGKLNEALNNEVAYYERYSRPFGIILMDIDFFKTVNDTYGHLVGDMILVTISKLMQSSIRITDILGRWGGEEFLIICPGTDREGIGKMAEKLRNTIESYNFPEIKKSTASFGGTVFRENENLTQIIKRADDALYQAKKSGRNKVVIQ